MNDLSSDKYKSFWPFPGGVESFVKSSLKCLKFIQSEKPSEERLRKWFLETFPSITKERIVRGYITTVLKHSGLVTWDRSGFYLTEDGEKYLEDPKDRTLFEILDKNVTGFREIIQLLGAKSLNLHELHKELNSRLGVKWKKAYAQPYFRASWLRSMGFVELRGHEYRLTNKGQELLESLGEVPPEKKERLEEFVREGIAEVEKEKEKVETPITLISKRLKDTEHASDKPDLYEQAIADAFRLFGFDVTSYGGPGQTDVIAMALMGSEGYSLIVDGKTTSRERIIDRQVSWPTIEDHRKQHKADYAAIVGPNFAGGDLLERAEKYGVLLIETDTLIQLLKIHEKTPLTLVDLKEPLSKTGLLRLEDCLNLVSKKEGYKRQLELIAKLLYKLLELQKAGDRTSITDLRWALGKKFDSKEIGETLELLKLMGVVKCDEREEYIAIMTPEGVENKLKSLTEAIKVKIKGK